MTVHTAYEVRVFRNADWHIEVVLDDESLAVAAAKKIEARTEKTPVVVVQEIYDAARNHLKSRSVYRSAPAVKSATTTKASPAKRTANRPTATAEPQRAVHTTRTAEAKAEGAGVQVSWALFGLMLAAVAAYMALRTFAH